MPDGKREMRVAHCVGFYFPENVGGTEVYVRDLAESLAPSGVSSSIIAATDRLHEEYVWAGVPVLRYPPGWSDLEGETVGPTGRRLSRFQEMVMRARPDIFHLHSWTTGAGLKHLEQVAELGIPCVVTMHVPSALCLRGTMLLEGAGPCDGRIEEKRCTRCWALSRGLPYPAAFAVSQLPRLHLPPDLGRKLGRLGTVLSARALVNRHKHELRRMSDLSRKVVAPSQWVYAALAENGVPAANVFISRQAVAGGLVARGREAQAGGKAASPELRIGFVGRLEPYKGPHILLEAMKAIPRDVPVRLIIAGSGTEFPYLRTLEALAAGDPRIEFLGPVSHGDLPGFLRRIDVLAVPSNYMETGPLVVLEAFAFGIPVMGADIGGIAERIQDGVDGWLLPFRDVAAWARTIQEVAVNRDIVQQRTANVKVGRTMDDVAAEMAAIYREVLTSVPPEPR